ncbi:YceH family protein [Aliivibrio sp. EL58]|uniref:YceH family protein n=1 Tax=Aliivibrio sp. EL58 TaxID=2107582 RepID=UPI000EFAF92F|nr:DUF480 domain-containing protein [Aliivibrio sp. EL58]
MRIITQAEIRVIGCLIEKEITTPEHYPLTLNALTNACNQKSNRDPVTSMTDSNVLDALNALIKDRLVTDETRGNSRVAKYQHRFCNTEFGSLKLSSQEIAILCVLFLRGPQTPGELRTRTQRLCEFENVAQVEAVLNKLAADELSPKVVKLSKEPGKREARYGHLFCGELSDSVADSCIQEAPTQNTEKNERIEQLEIEVSQLRTELNELKQLVNEVLS